MLIKQLITITVLVLFKQKKSDKAISNVNTGLVKTPTHCPAWIYLIAVFLNEVLKLVPEFQYPGLNLENWLYRLFRDNQHLNTSITGLRSFAKYAESLHNNKCLSCCRWCSCGLLRRLWVTGCYTWLSGNRDISSESELLCPLFWLLIGFPPLIHHSAEISRVPIMMTDWFCYSCSKSIPSLNC